MTSSELRPLRQHNIHDIISLVAVEMGTIKDNLTVLKEKCGNFIQLHGLAFHETLFTVSSSDVICWINDIFNDSRTDYDEILQLICEKIKSDKIVMWETGQDNLSMFLQNVRNILQDIVLSPSNENLKCASDRLFLLILVIREQIKLYPEERDSIQRVAEETALYFVSILKSAVRRKQIKKSLMFVGLSVFRLLVSLLRELLLL